VVATQPPDSVGAKYAYASCPTGKSLISGAGTINSPNGQVVLDTVAPSGDPPTTAVFVALEDDTGNSADWGVTGYAICAASARRSGFAGARQPASNMRLEASCGAGTQATGVGGEITGGLGRIWLSGLHVHTTDPARFELNAVSDETTDIGASSWFPTIHGICATTIPPR
jgi:hypothetical protein